MKLAGYYSRVSDLNETMITRKNYRINNEDMHNFELSLKTYDASIFILTVALIKILEEEIFNLNALEKGLNEIEGLKTRLEDLKSENNKIKDFLKIKI